MQKRIVINNGKKYIVNCPGYEDSIGPIAPQGTLWMKSSDGNWYAINASGSSDSDLSYYVNQTPLDWQDVGGQDFGYQLLYCNQDNNIYQAYLSGSSGDVTMSISQTPWTSNADYKPYLFLKSITDDHFYAVYAKSGSI